MARLLTDQQAADIPELVARTPEGRATLLQLADTIYAHVQANPWCGEDAVRRRAEQAGYSVDDTTAALAFLQGQGLLLTAPDADVVPQPALPAAAVAALDDLPLADLKSLAKARGITGYSTMRKGDLVEELQGGGGTPAHLG